jgi:hypothetical protein
MIFDKVSMKRETVCLMLTEELGIRNICAKLGPTNLTGQKREVQLGAVFEILMHYSDAAASLLN